MCYPLHKRTQSRRLVVLLVAFGLTLPVAAQTLTSSVVAAAGGNASNASYQLASTLGEPILGRAQTATQVYQAGFWLTVEPSTTTGTAIEDGGAGEVPSAYQLAANYPNPFNPQTIIRYALPEPASVRLAVYDALGRRVRVLVDRQQAAGWHETAFAAENLPSGLYFYRLDAGSFSEVRTMLLIK